MDENIIYPIAVQDNTTYLPELYENQVEIGPSKTRKIGTNIRGNYMVYDELNGETYEMMLPESLKFIDSGIDDFVLGDGGIISDITGIEPEDLSAPARALDSFTDTYGVDIDE